MSGETDFIAQLRALATHPAARGLEDDCAVLELDAATLVLTHDSMIAGRHWLASQDMADVAWKLVAVNLSDLAAKGAQPVGILLSHTLGVGDDRFIAGLQDILREYDVPLLGGDTVAGDGARTLGCTAIGLATHTPVPDRRGARAGDVVWLTGTVGQAMLGFEALRDSRPGNTLAYRRPQPLLSHGRVLAPVVTAMMDVSDGLLLDCQRLAIASHVTIDIDSSEVPVADNSRRDECMRWGDDYQLLFTAAPNVEPPVPAHRIGTVAVENIVPLWVDGHPPEQMDRLGYSHERS